MVAETELIRGLEVRVSVLEERSVNYKDRLDNVDVDILSVREDLKEIRQSIIGTKALLQTHITQDMKDKNRVLLLFIFVITGVYVPNIWDIAKGFVGL